MKRIAVFLAAALLAACSSSTTSTEAPSGEAPDAETFAFGEPADPSEADRVVEITASDDLSFTPDEIAVAVGETVTFRVTNEGAIVHDFTVGDEEAQEEHEAEMAEMPGMAHEEPNLLTLDPGETDELTWRFTTPGTVLLGCHQPGHYAGGMVATVTVG